MRHYYRTQNGNCCWSCQASHPLQHLNIPLALTAAGLATPETSCGTSTTGHRPETSWQSQSPPSSSSTSNTDCCFRPETSWHWNIMWHYYRTQWMAKSHPLVLQHLTLTAASGLKHHAALLQDMVNGNVTHSSASLWHWLLLVLPGLKHHVALLQDTVNGNATHSSTSLWHWLLLALLKHHVALLQDTVNGNATHSSTSLWHWLLLVLPGLKPIWHLAGHKPATLNRAWQLTPRYKMMIWQRTEGQVFSQTPLTPPHQKGTHTHEHTDYIKLNWHTT